MKISFNWLKEYIEITESVEHIGDLLTSCGLEVEGIEKIESVKGGLEGLVVGEVMSCDTHPNADKLKLTTIDIGQEERLSVVCGAPNVAQGQKVILATVGTTLYPVGHDSFKIKKSKIRGELSQGMICAEDEIGLGSSHDGIIVLEKDFPNGTPAKEVFDLGEDYVFEIGLTPNRVDASSHYGVVRDLAVLLNREAKLPDVSALAVDNNDYPIAIKVENIEACPRYSGVTITGIQVQASPTWLQDRLKAIGIEPINNIVDITNYVLHETGQPLHAFDADQIANKEVIVTTLAEGTPFVALDEKERKLKEKDLMICDGDRNPMCMAGIFGGLNSGTTTATTNVFLESAYFSPTYVRKSSLVHGLKTDAAFRFERGVDPNGTLYALKRAASLIIELAGGKLSSEIVEHYPQEIKAFDVALSLNNVERLLGISIAAEEIERILSGLEIAIDKQGDCWNLKIPAYRVDVQREADVIEEIARLYGYDKITVDESLSTHYMSPLLANDEHGVNNAIANFLAATGFNEIVTNSLTKASNVNYEDRLQEEDSVPIHNYLSEDLNVLRQSMLVSGLEVIAYNANRKQTDLKFFELGKTYHLAGEEFSEKLHLALYLSGNNHAESWVKKTENIGYYDILPTVRSIFALVGIKDYRLESCTDNTMDHAAVILDRKGHQLATFGLLSSKLLKQLGIKQTTVYADIDLDYILNRKPQPIAHKTISKYPEVRRDLSLVIDKTVTFERIMNCALKAERKLVKDINVFDVYEGDKIDADKKAYALSFILHDQDKTLTDKVIDKSMNRLMQSFEKELGAIIRK